MEEYYIFELNDTVERTAVRYKTVMVLNYQQIYIQVKN